MATEICDCERSHNGMGIAGRKCDCLVERMRAMQPQIVGDWAWRSVLDEAAARIEALEAENARLRAALTPSADRPLRYCDYCKAWQSKPCGEGCVWTPACPTLEQRAALPHP